MSCRLCEKCQREPATVHITELAEGARAAERHLCRGCAGEEGTQLPISPAGSVLRIEEAPPNLLCERCQKNPASVHTTEIVDGKVRAERNLCDQCAPRKSADAIVPASPEPTAGLTEEVRDAILASAQVKQRFAGEAAPEIARAVELVAECLRTGHKVLLCGNGGSAAEAQHIAAELVGRFQLERPALPAIALTTNASILTAIANDYTFDDVFARQVGGLGAPGDVLFAYSTSGSSKNVLRAIQAAKIVGMKTVGFTGASGGQMAHLCDVCINVPSDDTPIVQESHTAAGHTICRLVERLLFP